MSAPMPTRPVNPRLGTYYAIFASALAAIFIVAAMLDQLGVRRLLLSHIAIGAPLILSLVVAIATRTLEEREFYVAGRRVPAVFGGLGLAATAIGGVGFFSVIGAHYLLGFDALAIPLGITAGFAVSAVLLAPYIYKTGAFTMPGFFRQRFDSEVPGIIAGLLLLPPCFLLLCAELQAGAFVAALFTSVTFANSVWLGALMVCLMTVLGGMRSLSWTQCVQYLAIVCGLLVPLVIVSTIETNLPVPHLTYGGLLDRISGQEIATGAARTVPLPLVEALPGGAPQAAIKPFLQA
ncbi:MAG: sodium:solute symporter, partial [Pseudomonadota bacterium]|nr:sodium:solute symporter [Pseudomonadota bacterium]